MIARFRTYASFVRVGHSAFALPFAFVGALLAARHAGFEWSRLVWITICMVSARSAALAFNRLVDAGFDARNPRTAGRELPAGRVSVVEARVFVGVATVIFIGSAAALGPLCLALSPVALAIVFWYSLAKRYTAFTQGYLGLAMAVAPAGGWIAAGGPRSAEPWLLGLAIAGWVAGFDIIYACQDVEVNRREGLHSIPVKYGIPGALRMSRLLHAATVVVLVLVGAEAGLDGIYVAGVVFVGLMLWWEQSLVSPDDLSQVMRAFNVNAWVGVVYFATTALAVFAS